MRTYVMYTWVERMRYHRTGRGDLRTKGHLCTGPYLLYPGVVDRVTARTSTGLLASLFKQFLSKFTREWTRSGRAVAGPKGIHALVPPCFTCLCGRFCDCAHDQQAAEASLKQFLQGHSIDMLSYVMYTWVERMRHHRTGRGDLRTKGHPCTGPNMLHTPTW